MAEATISLLIRQLGSPLLKKFGSICMVDKELNNLCSNFEAIQTVLKDAEEQQWTSNTIRGWLDKLQDVADEVRNILDEFATERRRAQIRNSANKKVHDFFTPSKNPVAFKSNMSNKIKQVAERLEVIAREKSNYNLRHEDDVDRHKEAGSRIPTHSFVHKSEVHGREEDNDKLVDLLVNRGDDEEENVSIVPIVAMGGFGKTVVAQLFYNDERVISYFDGRMWVFVSEKFDRAEIMRAIIASVNGERCDLEQMDPLQSLLRKTLSEKRYLLVLDDVWNENQEAWLQLKSVLNVGKKGSKIIVTTRCNIVANLMGTLPTYHLEGLQDEDCWSLFKQRAFPKKDEDDEKYSELVRIGKEIVKKCKGVPLVAMALGGLLHYKRGESEWLSIRNNEIWELKEDHIMPTLRLSYNNLPSHLKQCFTYCIVFHKGGTFKQQEVIQMWIAQGLIQSSEGGKLMEDIGAEYFEELRWRSFFQEEVMDYVPRHTEEGPEYKMHDLIYDLAKLVRRTECSTVKASRMEPVHRKTRHFSFYSVDGILLTDPMSFHNAQKLQTLILEDIRIEKHEILEDISSLTWLRVLKLKGTHIKVLPNSINKLKHLRYLELSWADIETLPESICTLWNLQTLKLLYCANLRELPNNMCKMISLRHLEIRGSNRMTQMPARFSELSDLHTLTLFIVSKENGIDELRVLNLRGSIYFQNLQNVLNPSDADKVGLRVSDKLSSLGLSWKDSHDSTAAENENCQQVIENLQPHSNLQCLSIDNYMGSRFPNWLMHLTVPNLIKISLISCKRCKILPPFSQLHHLKDLTIQDMPDLEQWSSDERNQTLPHIKRVEIRDCPKLSQMPHLPSVEDLKLIGCNEMLLMSIGNCTAITLLSISGFPEMISLPEGLLKNLTLIKDLYIENCPKLKSLSKDVHNLPAIKSLALLNCGEVESLMEGVRNLTSLEFFSVSGCNQLKSLPDEGFQGLTSLHYLCIQVCGNLRSLGEGLQIQHLNSLAFLNVGGCPKLAALPDSLYKLTTLETLYLSDLPKLASLSEEIGNLASLVELSIEDCPHLLSLPASLQKVTTLQSLRIESCPSLEKRCAKAKGEDWYKIAHVSIIVINGQCLQELRFRPARAIFRLSLSRRDLSLHCTHSLSRQFLCRCRISSRVVSPTGPLQSVSRFSHLSLSRRSLSCYCSPSAQG